MSNINNQPEPTLADFFAGEADAQRLPLLYRFTEYYNRFGTPYAEVEGLNMVYSDLHQTPKHVVGFFYKHIVNLDLDTTKTLPLEKA